MNNGCGGAWSGRLDVHCKPVNWYPTTTKVGIGTSTDEFGNDSCHERVLVDHVVCSGECGAHSFL